MSNLEDEVKDLKEKNNELVQKVQYWKMTAAQRENEKLDLMKEINELRLKLSRIRSGGAAQVRQLDVALQAASQEALTHLVQASSAVARTLDLTKAYMRDRQELDASSPRWSNISGTPTKDRVNRVPPLLIGGQSIQPVVSLSRTLLNSSGSRSINRSPNQQNRNVTERAVPMHMLQDVYIPLTRIDAAELLNNNMETDAESNNIEDSSEDLGLEDSSERIMEESQNLSDIEFENSRRLDAVTEDLEPEDEDQTPPLIPRARVENPLEGPSWLLDIQNTQANRTKCRRVNLEPDSTTEFEENSRVETPPATSQIKHTEAGGCEFSPTVRRRKRTSSPRTPCTPHYSPRPAPRRNSINGRVLKVLVSKMRLDDDEDGTNDVSPPKRVMRGRSPLRSPKNKSLPPQPSLDGSPSTPPVQDGSLSKRLSRDLPLSEDLLTKRMMRFDAPSPNGSTDTRVIVSESNSGPCGSGEPSDTMQRVSRSDTPEARRDTSATRRDTSETRRNTREVRRDTHETRRDTNSDSRRDHASRCDTRDSDSCRDAPDSDSSTERAEGRARRPRKAVTYKEKPLNRKLRR